MREEPIQIKRYPNRRFYSRDESKYVSLADIERLIRDGNHVEIRDSQSGEDLTRAVLAQIIMERQPDKMTLFPVDMLHFIVRSNDLMTGFLRDYFRSSLTYLEYLQNHSTPVAAMAQPMHWMKAWLDGLAPANATVERGNDDGDDVGGDYSAAAATAPGRAETDGEAEGAATSASSDAGASTAQQANLERRVQLLEERLRQLEGDPSSTEEAS